MVRESEFSSSHNRIPRDMTSTQMRASSPLGEPQGNSLSAWDGSYMNSNCSYLPNMSAYVNLPNSGFGQVHSTYAVHGWGRGGRYDNVQRPQLYPHYEFGRGSGRYPNFRSGKGRSLDRNLSAGSGPSGRSRKYWKEPVSADERPSAEERPDLYYDNEMLEDPWKGMTPVIWDGPPPVKSQLPKSVGVKRARTSSEDSQKSISHPSLAEHLASSFDKNIDERDA